MNSEIAFFQIINDSNRSSMELDNFQKFFWAVHVTNENSDILKKKLGHSLHEHLDAVRMGLVSLGRQPI